MEITLLLITFTALAFVVWPVVPQVLAEAGGALAEGVRDWWPHGLLLALILAAAQVVP